MIDWNPGQYHRYQRYRRKPWEDLLSGVQRREGLTVLDLGCGTGELTAAMHRELEATSTLGIDSSPAMLAGTEEHAGDGVSFEKRDIAEFLSDQSQHGRWDLVFSNAALHWLEDHHRLWPALKPLLAPSGQLAIQIPANHTHLSHTTAAEVASTNPFMAELDGWTLQSSVLEPVAYSHLLFEMGFEEPEVELRVYPQALDSREHVVEWVKGSLLTAYQKRMSPTAFESFVKTYRETLFNRLPDEEPFFYPYRRILQWAQLS